MNASTTELSNLNTYKVLPGDTLGSIASSHNVTVSDLARINNISDINRIIVGLNLVLPDSAEQIPDHLSVTPTLLSTEEIKLLEADINQKDSLSIINYHYIHNNIDQPYVVFDKANKKISVYKNGRLLGSARASGGANTDSDDMTITHTDDNGKLRDMKGNLSTPAGIYWAKRINDYHGHPAFQRFTEQLMKSGSAAGIPSSMHFGNTSLGSNGCIRLSPEACKLLGKYIGDGLYYATYTLPYHTDKNKFFIRNGQIQFQSGEGNDKLMSLISISSSPIAKISISNELQQLLNTTNHYRHHTQLTIVNKFIDGLIKNKEQLLKDLGINDDTYNQLAKVSLGILGVESNYGDENSATGNLMRAVRKAFNRGHSSPDYKSKYDVYNAKSDNNSIGLTQMRWKYFVNEETTPLIQKYGITKDDLVNNPLKAAIATMIKLATEYKRQGLSIDNAIKSWNTKQAYVDMVKRNAAHFNVYTMY